MKKLICKVCKKEYYRKEDEVPKDSGCCSSLCESRYMILACRRRDNAGACDAEGSKK